MSAAKAEKAVKAPAKEKSPAKAAKKVVDIKDALTELTMSPGFRADSVEIDPGYEILRWTPELRALANATPPG